MKYKKCENCTATYKCPIGCVPESEYCKEIHKEESGEVQKEIEGEGWKENFMKKFMRKE